MGKKLNIIFAIGTIGAVAVAMMAAAKDQKDQKRARKGEYYRKLTSKYEQYVKRPLDCVLSMGAFAVLSPIMGVTALLVRTKLGLPVLFTQQRPGMIDPETGEEKIFKLYKFRTMTDERDNEGNLLPDEGRLTNFGKMLRSTSLDELPELLNIIKGDMAVIGPRPQLVKDMVFMTKDQRRRHLVRPGLSGWAQVNGRNSISWENKLQYDLEYIAKITFWDDAKIVFMTVMKAFIKREGITEEGTETAADYGDYLLRTGKVDREKYDQLQRKAKMLLEEMKW